MIFQSQSDALTVVGTRVVIICLLWDLLPVLIPMITCVFRDEVDAWRWAEIEVYGRAAQTLVRSGACHQNPRQYPLICLCSHGHISVMKRCNRSGRSTLYGIRTCACHFSRGLEKKTWNAEPKHSLVQLLSEVGCFLIRNCKLTK